VLYFQLSISFLVVHFRSTHVLLYKRLRNALTYLLTYFVLATVCSLIVGVLQRQGVN